MLLFLTNSSYYENGEAASFARLISPPIVVEVKYEDLQKENYLTQSRQEPRNCFNIKHLSDRNDGRIMHLATDNKSMNFFRCQSHLYPLVQPVLTDRHCLTLKFYGSETMCSSAVVFRLSEDPYEAIKSDKLKGYHLNQE